MDFDRLREESRRKYLEKRVRDQARIRKENIEGKKIIIGDQLTETERREIQIDESILELSKQVNKDNLHLEYRLDGVSEKGTTLDERLQSISKHYSEQEQANPFLQKSENWERERMNVARILPSNHQIFEKPREISDDKPIVYDFKPVQESLPVFKYKQDLLEVRHFKLEYEDVFHTTVLTISYSVIIICTVEHLCLEIEVTNVGENIPFFRDKVDFCASRYACPAKMIVDSDEREIVLARDGQSMEIQIRLIFREGRNVIACYKTENITLEPTTAG